MRLVFLWLLIVADYFVDGSFSLLGSQAKAHLQSAVKASGDRAKEQWQRTKSITQERGLNGNVEAVKRLASGIQRPVKSIKEQAAQRWAKAKDWLSSDNDDTNTKNFKDMEAKMISYFATDPDPGNFHAQLVAYDISRKNSKQGKVPNMLDVPDKAGIIPNPFGGLEPPEPYSKEHKCVKRCLSIYGYVIEVKLREYDNDSDDNNDNDDDDDLEAVFNGTVIPITRGVVTCNRWKLVRNYISQRQNCAYLCDCETREDFRQLLKGYNIDPESFDQLKTFSSKDAITYLTNKFSGIKSLQWMSHDSLVRLMVRRMWHAGLHPTLNMGGRGYYESANEEYSKDSIMADRDYWQETMFYRLSTSRSNDQLTPSPSLLKKLREAGWYSPESPKRSFRSDRNV